MHFGDPEEHVLLDRPYFRTDQNQTLDLPSKDGLDIKNIKYMLEKNLLKEIIIWSEGPTQIRCKLVY